MRDIALTLMVLGALPFILKRPYIGVLVWSWLGYMNPHRFTFSFAYSAPFAQIVAITLLISVFLAKEKIRVPASGILYLWAAFCGWMVITTVFAIYPDGAWGQLAKVLKIQLVIFLTIILMNDFKKINQLIWVIVLSIGFFSVKGGLFTLMTGGAHRVWGPAGSFIEENNSLAVATLMVVPLMVYLRHLHKKTRWLNVGLAVAVILSMISVVGSQSRGALVAIFAVGLFFWLKTRAKIVSGLLLVTGGSLLFAFMPQSWHARMGLIKDYEEDASALGRLNAWEYSVNLANDRLTGGGFESWSTQTFAIWAPDPSRVHAAHSIYFGTLGDHGWIGLILFLFILWATWRTLAKVVRITNSREDSSDRNFLARMLQVSLIAYMSGGAFLSLTYFDLPWHLIAISILLMDQLGDRKGLVGNEAGSVAYPGKNTSRKPADQGG